MIEEWKPVRGLEGRYEVSSHGRIRSLCYKGHKGHERILNPSVDSLGYKTISVYINDKHKVLRVHRLVADAFIPKCENKDYVDHINGVRTDNSVGNLRWCSHAENMSFPNAIKNLSYSHVGLRMDDSVKARIATSIKKHRREVARSILQFSLNGELVGEWCCIQEAAEVTGINNISACCRGIRSSAGGYVWRYK